MSRLRVGLLLVYALTVVGSVPGTAESASEEVRDTLIRLPPVDLAEPGAVDFLSLGDLVNDGRVRVDSASRTVRTTTGNQIVLELAPSDMTDANFFDLSGRTVVFTPDGQGGYFRSVQSVAWERNIGERVSSSEEVSFQGFEFEFAGGTWTSFFVSHRGIITFGKPLQYDYVNSGLRFETMQQLNHKLVNETAISALYKPLLGGFHDQPGPTQHVAHQVDRVVVTWTTTEPVHYVHGVAPQTSTRFQAVLAADGSVRLNYDDSISFRDGIVGLLGPERKSRGTVIAEIDHGQNTDLPGYLDLQKVTLQESGTGGVIVEFTMREPIPVPPPGHLYVYRLFFDVEQPWFNTAEDLDFDWRFYVTDGGLRLASGAGVAGVVETTDPSRIALLANTTGLEGVPVAVFGASSHFAGGNYVEGESSEVEFFELPSATGPNTDLSEAVTLSAQYQYEVFNYPTVENLDSIACHVTNSLGDEFDLLVFHSQFRTDKQEATTPFRPFFGNDPVTGVGRGGTIDGPPCGAKRLKGRWVSPVWIYSDQVYRSGVREDSRYDYGLWLFAHEFSHLWLAYVSRNRNGQSSPLVGDGCLCHWQAWLHAPAAFPWHPDQAGPRSLMGGRDWRSNDDGTFTELNGVWNGGFSWLDLYLMGLADVGEVPDFFILRNGRRQSGVRYTGVRENVSIQQVLDVHGMRKPSAANAQKDFNAGFVYLLEPGESADRDGLALQARFRDQVADYWSHITGGRSRFPTGTSTTDPEPDPEPDPDPPPPPLKAVLAVPQGIKTGTPAVFDGSGSTGADSYYWSFGDGTVIRHPSTVAQPTHTYVRPGTYTVAVEVAAGTCGEAYCEYDSTSATVVVESGPPPTAGFNLALDCEGGLCTAWTGAEVEFEDASSGTVEHVRWDFGDGETSRDRNPKHTWTSPGFYRVVLTAHGLGEASTASRDVLVRASDPAGTCEPDKETLCLRDSRYRVRARWQTADGAEGQASVAHAGTNDSGLFWFFDRENWEMLIKVLDGCAVNGNVWVFGASTTNLGYTISVTDTVTDDVRVYRNQPGKPAPALTDTEAFPNACMP